MTKREFEKMGKSLLPSLPKGFVARENLIFIHPIGQLLRGICFGNSIEKKSFYVSTFLKPICVPSEYIGMSLGCELNGGRSWNADNTEVLNQLLKSIQENALPYIMPMQSLEDMVAKIDSDQTVKDSHVHQAIAFSLARIGKIDKACEKLEKLAEQMSGPNEYNMKIPWREEMAQRALYLRSLLLKDPQAAQKQLDEWEAYTIKNLKLEKYR